MRKSISTRAEPHSLLEATIAAEAAAWFARLHEISQSRHLSDEFYQWLQRSPAHVDELLSTLRRALSTDTDVRAP
jgi:ferric-dicitrate binding protein FerR (iron transport regulator)